MRKITANIIFPVSGAPLKNSYLVLDDNNTIVDIVSYDRNSKEIEGLEYYSGILIPGFVNAHCHLELSHLKNKFDEKKGLKRFVKQVQSLRNKPENEISQSIEKALNYMWSRGINACADIANSNYGLNQKKNSKIEFYNFVELFNEADKTIDSILNVGSELCTEYSAQEQQSSIVPHSMYGTNRELLKGINALALPNDICSIHFLESHWEANISFTKIVDYLKQLEVFQRVLLVHNIHLNKDLLHSIKSQTSLFNKLYWVVCPKSNLFIDAKLPPISDFYSWNLPICIGTDSLASNYSLSIFDELKCIAEHFPDIPFSRMLEWSTINGAMALGMQKQFGSFEKGKTPGVLLLENFDFKRNHINSKTSVTRIV